MHIGHVAMLNEAARLGEVIVALNSDDWLRRKKGYVFMTYEARALILGALWQVSSVVPVDDRDGTVCEALRRERPAMFLNGGDRVEADPTEDKVCRELGIIQRFGCGGGKIESSSRLIEAVRQV